MTNGQKWFVIVGLFFVGLLGGVFAQQQFSGGQAVTITSGSVTATQASGANLHVDVDSAPTTTVSGTVSLSALPALVAGTAQIGVTTPRTGCGATAYESGSPVGFSALSASTVTLTSTTTCALTVVITNTGSASFTYYLTDAQSSAVSVIGSSGNPITILPGERDEYDFPNGAKFNSGIKLTASAATGTYYVFGVQ
jgi:hypothetical protein